MYVTLSHVRSKGISCVGVVHTQHFIRGGGRTEVVDKGSWLVDEANIVRCLGATQQPGCFNIFLEWMAGE